MVWPFYDKALLRYWLKVFALYVLVEAGMQLLFLFILNNFGSKRISTAEFHLVMLLFQSLLIWPIWWVAKSLLKQNVLLQFLANAIFYVLYTYFWFGPVQDAIAATYDFLQAITRAASDRQPPPLDDGSKYSYLNYQLLKHAFRLSWFYLANYFYQYRLEENQRIALAVSNQELELKLQQWKLKPAFYFSTIQKLQDAAAQKPSQATEPILHLAKVMEYIIYESRHASIEMKKELEFLSSYIKLVNEQRNQSSGINFSYQQGYEQLKIAPLVMVAIIDNILLSSTGNNDINMQVYFQQQQMCLDITGLSQEPLLTQDTKKIAGKTNCKYDPTEKKFQLQMMLDEI